MWNNQSEQGFSSRNEKRITVSETWRNHIQEKGCNSSSILEGYSCCQHDFHDSTMVDVPRRNEVSKKPICIFQYNMFMKGVDMADQYLSYYSLLRKTVKWPKKVAFWLINCALFNSFRIFQKLNPT